MRLRTFFWVTKKLTSRKKKKKFYPYYWKFGKRTISTLIYGTKKCLSLITGTSFFVCLFVCCLVLEYLQLYLTCILGGIMCKCWRILCLQYFRLKEIKDMSSWSIKRFRHYPKEYLERLSEVCVYVHLFRIVTLPEPISWL